MRTVEEHVKSLLRTFTSPRYFPIHLIFLLIILTLFKVHGSSIGMYNKYFYGELYTDRNLISGSPRPIRSDEWLVLTPLTIAQVENNFAKVNKNIGLGQDAPVSISIPTFHWSTLFQPPNWAFFFMPLENAFTFKWWFRATLLLIGIYLLVLSITGGNYFLAVSSSLLFFFTPFIQWWYSTHVLETIAYGAFVAHFFIKLFHFKHTRDLIMNSILLAYFSICYALILYPPFQIAVGLLVLALLTGYILNNLQMINKARIRVYIVAAGATLVAITGVLLTYYISFRNDIQLLQNTSYPGQRVITGGGFSLAQLFNGLFNIQLLNDSRAIPQIFVNQCEASSFFMLSLFILPVSLFYLVKNFLKERKTDFILLFVSSYLILTTLWILIGLPTPLARLLLLNKIPHSRMIIGIGVANLLLIIYWLARFKIPKTIGYKIASVLIALFGFLAHLYLGIYLKSNYPAFISNDLKILLISGFAFLSILLLLLQRQRLFMLSILLYAVISTLGVNPLYKGLDPLINSELSRQIQQIEKANTNNDRWVVYDTIILGNYLVANGVNSINGVHFYPQLGLWEKFDPQGEYRSIYNRYAHVVFKSSDDESSVSFLLDQADTFSVEINPCNTILKDLDVKYFVFNNRVDYKCLSEVTEVPYPSMPVYIFERL